MSLLLSLSLFPSHLFDGGTWIFVQRIICLIWKQVQWKEKLANATSVLRGIENVTHEKEYEGMGLKREGWERRSSLERIETDEVTPVC